MNARKRTVAVMLALGAAVLLATASAARAELFAQYNFENDTTATLYDTVQLTYDHTMTAVGTALTFDSTDKKVGTKSIAFNGGTSGSYAKYPWVKTRTDDPLATTALSISTWIKADGSGAQYMMPMAWCGADYLGASPNWPWTIQIAGTGATSRTLYFIIYDKYVNTPLNMNEWVHVGIVHEGTTSKIYLNDTLAVSGTTRTLPTSGRDQAGNPADAPLDLGNRWDSTYRYKGKMDDVGLWNEALSAAKMVSLFNVANSTLNYDVQMMDQLFGVFDAKTGSTTVGGLTWYYTPSGIASAEGALGDLGGGNYAINFGGGEGVSTIPEPSALALLACGLLGLLAYAWRRKK